MFLLAHAPILIVWIILAWMGYDSLPERIPTHFDASGTPDGYMARSFSSWFLLPLVGVITVLTILFSTVITSRHPARLNVPNKKVFLALTREQQKPLTEMVNTSMTVMSLLTLLFLASLHYDTWRVATNTMPGLSFVSMGALGLLLAITVAGTIWFMVTFNRRVKEAAAQNAARDSARR